MGLYISVSEVSSIFKPTPFTTSSPILLQLAPGSNIAITGTLLISQDKVIIVMLYYNYLFNNIFLLRNNSRASVKTHKNNLTYIMVEANNNTESAHQNLLQNKPLGDSSNHEPKGLHENNDKIASIIESMKKLSIVINGRDTEAVCDLGSDYPIITYEKAKELGLEIDKSLSNITDQAVSDIVEQVSVFFAEIPNPKSQILPAIKQDIINSIVKQSISRRIPCKAKRKCKITNMTILNDTASESSFDSGSESDSSSRTESVSKKDLSETEIMEIINAVKAEKIKLKESSPGSGSE
ncbi:hypothetical protein Glove_117g524 [Diversispora epigaea]|uniref:Uncharacterized protein n=1 Tax=Diversispora epigaea TaxID=1348612 RepID=A0A397J0Z4_9GLOM|nr:hypothetical protein Glove_117g524 [Diversispora epigaea]